MCSSDLSGDPTLAVTTGGITGGTPAYQAPEALLEGAVDGRADLFSLGLILYEMLTGTQPHLRDTLAATVAVTESPA